MASSDDRRWLVLTVVCAVLSFVLPAFIFHGYIKIRLEKRMSADDLFIALAGVIACANGFAAHTADLPREYHSTRAPTVHNGDVTEALKFWYLSVLLHILASCTARIAIGLASMGTRAFPSRRRLVTTNLVISTMASILFLVLLLFQCRPTAAFWSRNRADVPNACYTTSLAGPWYAFLTTTLAADALLASLAVASLVKRRYGSWGIQAVTAFFNLFAVGHLLSTALQITQIPALLNYTDLTYSATNFAIYSLLGPSFAVFAANMTKIGPLVRRLDIHLEGETVNQQLARELERSQRRQRQPLSGFLRAGATASPPPVRLRGEGEGDEAALDEVVARGIARLERAEGVAAAGGGRM